MTEFKGPTNDSKADDAGKIIRKGAAAAWPICLGYVTIGVAYGVLARQAGIEWWAVGLMSVLVFAGSSQFIAVSMLAAGAGAPAIIVTTFFVNLRHTLMSSALAIYLHGVSWKFLAVFGYGVTDESFALNVAHFQEGDWDRHRAIVVNQLINFTWISASLVGALLGQFLPPGAFGIDYAITGMFICLLVMQIYGIIYVITGVIAGLVAVGWYIAIPGDSYIVGAALCAATIGYFLKRRARRPQ